MSGPDERIVAAEEPDPTRTTAVSPAPRTRRRLVAQLVSAILFLPTVVVFLLGRLGPDHIEALTSPWTWHACVTLLLCAAVFAALRAWWRAAVAGVLLCWALAVTLPVVVPAAASASPGPGSPVQTIAVMNTLVGTAPGEASRAWLASLDADLLAIPECSTPWDEAIRAVGRWPYAIVKNDDHAPGGIALFSKHQIMSGEAALAPGATFSHVEAIVECPGGPVRVFAIHPPPPVRRALVEARVAEFAWLATRVTHSTIPVIVLGDFNDTRFGRTYATFVGATGLQPVSRVAFPRGTWPTRVGSTSVPRWFGIAIDHVLVSRKFELLGFEVGPELESDHRPVVARVRRLP